MQLGEITEIENRYVVDGEPVLGLAYAAFLERWELGSRDRETCLRLLFLAWYACVEPESLTSLTSRIVVDDANCSRALLFGQIFDWLGGVSLSDPEALLVVGWMAKWPYCCGAGAEDAWVAVGTTFDQRYNDLSEGQKVSSAAFHARGAYGQYFEHVSRQHYSSR
jgi:hypothetical protein